MKVQKIESLWRANGGPRARNFLTCIHHWYAITTSFRLTFVFRLSTSSFQFENPTATNASISFISACASSTFSPAISVHSSAVLSSVIVVFLRLTSSFQLENPMARNPMTSRILACDSSAFFAAMSVRPSLAFSSIILVLLRSTSSFQLENPMARCSMASRIFAWASSAFSVAMSVCRFGDVEHDNLEQHKRVMIMLSKYK